APTTTTRRAMTWSCACPCLSCTASNAAKGGLMASTGATGRGLSRRVFLQAGGTAALAYLASADAAQTQAGRPGMGVVLYSFTVRRFDDPAAFLEHCRTLGAGGVQMPLGARPEKEAARLLARAEKARMYLEGIVRLPRAPAD